MRVTAYAAGRYNMVDGAGASRGWHSPRVAGLARSTDVRDITVREWREALRYANL